jgi:hypothetical protein
VAYADDGLFRKNINTIKRKAETGLDAINYLGLDCLRVKSEKTKYMFMSPRQNE